MTVIEAGEHVGNWHERQPVGGTTAEEAEQAIAYAGDDTAAAVIERLHAAYPAGYRQAVNDEPGPGTDAYIGPARLATVMAHPYPERVDGYRAELRGGADIGPSLAVEHAGTHVLVDGTHRAVARVLEGQADIPVRIVAMPA